MHQPPVLTVPQQIVALRQISKLESQAKSWPRMRWYCIFQCIAMLIVSILFVSRGLSDVDLDCDRILKVMNDKQPLEDMPKDLWYAAELRRTVYLLALANTISMLGMLQVIIGMFNFIGVVYLGVKTYSDWDKAPWLTIQAKMLRWQVDQCSLPQLSPSPPPVPPATPA